jgi:adenine-specific DNA-methyltransferase
MRTPHAAHARALRRESTVAEEALWELLRDRRLDGLKFRRQHAWRRFILDFYCAAARLVVELDGEGHREEAQQVRDTERTRILDACGIRVLRFWNEQVLDDPESVIAAIRERASSPSSPLTPALSPTRGEGEPTQIVSDKS